MVGFWIFAIVLVVCITIVICIAISNTEVVNTGQIKNGIERIEKNVYELEHRMERFEKATNEILEFMKGGAK